MMTNSKDPRPRPEVIKAWTDKFRKIRPELPNPSVSAEAGRLINEQGRRAPLSSGLDPYNGPWQDANIIHLLRRTLFGIKKQDLITFRNLTLAQAVDVLLQPSPVFKSLVNNYDNLANNIKDPHVDLGESFLDAPHGADKEGYRMLALKGWHIQNMIFQQQSIHEKLFLFWHNLLPTKYWDVFITKASYAYSIMLRRNALGNYKTLIRQLTLDPSMLIFLNGASNIKEAPDENYGRELQELFCIGKGPDSKYTEGDVQAAARVLTGWSLDWTKYENPGQFTSLFNPISHDDSDKQFSEFYGNKVITGKSGANGAEELDELIDMIVGHEECARYICRRLYTFFVYTEIDEATELAIIRPLATIFRNNNFEILPVLRTLLLSSHFNDPGNHGVLIKNPLDYVIGLWRAFEAKSPSDNLNLDYSIYGGLVFTIANLGLEIGDPPNVAGWPAYYQAPQFDKSWITTISITERASLIDTMIFWGFWASPQGTVYFDPIAFAQNLDHPEDPTLLIRESVVLLMGLSLTENEVNNLKKILLSGQENDTYWTIAWNAHITDPSNEEHKLIVNTRLKAMFQRMLHAAECQLM